MNHGLSCDQSITLGVNHAAMIAGVGHNRIRQWVRSGKLPALPGKRILIVRHILIAFLEKQSRGQK